MQAAWLPALFSPDSTIRPKIIRPRRLRFRHALSLLSTPTNGGRPFSISQAPVLLSGRHTEAFGTTAPGDSVSGADSTSRRVLNGLADDAATRPNFLERVAIAFAVAALGYEASEPPRGVAWIARIRTQQKGTYNDFLTDTNFFLFFLGQDIEGGFF